VVHNFKSLLVQAVEETLQVELVNLPQLLHLVAGVAVLVRATQD
jgi:hypothetical protein